MIERTVPLQLDKDGKPTNGPHGEARSNQWPTARRHHLLRQPQCQWCGGTDKLQVHHKEPFHIDPSKELLESNFITLCEGRCHLEHGHDGDWKKFNPNIEADCSKQQKTWTCKKIVPPVVNREMLFNPCWRNLNMLSKAALNTSDKLDVLLADYHARGEKITALTAQLAAQQTQAATDLQKCKDDAAVNLKSTCADAQAAIVALQQRNTELLALSDAERISLSQIDAKLDAELPVIDPAANTQGTDGDAALAGPQGPSGPVGDPVVATTDAAPAVALTPEVTAAINTAVTAAVQNSSN